MRPRLLIAAIAALPLGGCQYLYDLRAVVIDGNVTFVVDRASRKKPRCVDAIEVSTRDGPRARPAEGDDRDDVARGVYWSQTVDMGSCEHRFPVRYGARLKGPPFIFEGRRIGSVVAAKPLRLGVVYSVETSSGIGTGIGCFRIRPENRRVENLDRDAG